MYPSRAKPYSGVFVKNQYYHLLDKMKGGVEIYYMERSFTNKAGSLVKYVLFFLGFCKFFFKKYTVVHVHYFGPHYFLALAYKLFHWKCRIIITFHGGDETRLDNLLYRWLASYSDTAIYVGSGQKVYVSSLKKYNVCIKRLPAGIDQAVFFHQGLREKKYDFIFVGSFYKVKGFDIFVKAVKKFNPGDVKICIVGSGPLEQQLKEELCGHSFDLFKDVSQERISYLLNKSKWLVFPSRGDSFGLAVSEALYCGTPVIASGILGVKDQVDIGKNSLLVSDLNSVNLFFYMRKAMLMPAHEYEKYKRSCIFSERTYSLDNVCRELINIYKAS
ncbi:glycosyltransferase family 4 protein [Halomonas denitrificans]|uniref:glycosyltransferase family 4 protein n=1 Tax=Halomonas denitrificans TaxID=370769 RepID=UPI000D3B6218|nr:glycosyltransferase family 4 protein [Halomonas denitrificans]